MPCCVSEPTSKPVQPQEDVSYATPRFFKGCAVIGPTPPLLLAAGEPGGQPLKFNNPSSASGVSIRVSAPHSFTSVAPMYP